MRCWHCYGIYLEQSASDLHMAPLVPLPPHHLLLHSKFYNGSPLWCQLAKAVLEIRLTKTQMGVVVAFFWGTKQNNSILVFQPTHT